MADPHRQTHRNPLRRGFRILVESVPTFLAAEGVLRAAALTYYTFFAIVPVFALVFGIAKSFGLDEWFRQTLLSSMHNHTEILTWLCKFADTTLREARGGVVAAIGALLLCWAVVRMVGNIENSFNQVWHVPHGRSLFRKITGYLPIFLIGVILVLTAGAALMMVSAWLRAVLGGGAVLGKITRPMLKFADSFLPYALSWLLLSLLYFFLPNTQVRWSAALFGGVIAGTLLRLLQSGYVFIQLALARYNAIYGSFAVLPLFLIWLNLNWLIVMYGVNLSYLWQNFGRKGLASGQHTS